MIRVKNLTFCYSDSARPALQGVNLEIEDGEFVLVTGPSGCGKSTLCRCLNGLVPHFHGGRLSGVVEANGLNTAKQPTKKLATVVGMVFQDPENQLVATDVEREIAFGLENLAFPRDLIAKRVEEALDTVGIAGLRKRRVHELSGGEKQKVVIASTLALHPDILVLDEPTSELDPKGAEEVLSIIERLNDELGITVVLVEHRLDRVAHHVDRIIVMENGGIFADGKPREVLARFELADIGVGVPPIVKMVQRLDGNGISIDGVPLTVKEGRTMLREVFRSPRSNALPRREEANGKPMIEMDGLWHAYQGGVTALKDVNLRLSAGEFVAIMGRNASGKTTLAKHVNGLLKPTRGRVRVAGVDTKHATVAQLASRVGFVFQNPNDHIFADTVEQEVAFILGNLGFGRQETARRVDEMLERFNLREYGKEYPRSLSGGERQRLAMASILVARPDILILDEPTRGMEYRLKAELMRLLNEYRGEGRTVVLVTHDVETVAEYADRVVLLSEGRVVVDGPTREVLSRALFFSPQINRLVQAFKGHGVPSDILTVDEAISVLK